MYTGPLPSLLIFATHGEESVLPSCYAQTGTLLFHRRSPEPLDQFQIEHVNDIGGLT